MAYVSSCFTIVEDGHEAEAARGGEKRREAARGGERRREEARGGEKRQEAARGGERRREAARGGEKRREAETDGLCTDGTDSLIVFTDTKTTLQPQAK